MQIRYIDEYGDILILPPDNPHKEFTPVVGDIVVVEDEEFRVKSRTFHIYNNILIIELTQISIKEKDPIEDGRFKEMQRVIVDINKRQDSQDKKSRLIREQLVSIRTHLRTQKNDT